MCTLCTCNLKTIAKTIVLSDDFSDKVPTFVVLHIIIVWYVWVHIQHVLCDFTIMYAVEYLILCRLMLVVTLLYA